MSIKDISFFPDKELDYGVDLLRQRNIEFKNLPNIFPKTGIGELKTLDLLAPHVIDGAAHLGEKAAFAHMDPPTPWITWVTSLWNAKLNQNLLHKATAPFAVEAEKLVID